MTILALTGWQQSKDALSNLVPSAQHFDYAAYNNTADMFAALPPAPELAIGWSLGGQLLVRAIAGGHIKPKALVLLSTPFQHISDAHFTHGVSAQAAEETRKNYMAKPQETLTQINSYIGYGDMFATRIIRTLNKTVEVWNNGVFWLDELGATSCRALDFSIFPKTFIVHGLQDKVIHPNHSQALADNIPGAQFTLWPSCGHAPHLHNGESLYKIISPYV